MSSGPCNARQFKLAAGALRMVRPPSNFTTGPAHVVHLALAVPVLATAPTLVLAKPMALGPFEKPSTALTLPGYC
ncbi:hypothetical protein DM02DRAFT_620758 [Periconia macrospinosa]|uniref:Uncharacterized protein n=1 Tax=Periconia macrospinosa TaxID=97972 RepID=A0A2V1D0I4_9PLEO|nr:hypothetical protein DM02DRAFT_620758 [Periconia macrospinosa]